jgi:CRP-like cAMP-binding protein
MLLSDILKRQSVFSRLPQTTLSLFCYGLQSKTYKRGQTIHCPLTNAADKDAAYLVLTGVVTSSIPPGVNTNRAPLVRKALPLDIVEAGSTLAGTPLIYWSVAETTSTVLKFSQSELCRALSLVPADYIAALRSEMAMDAMYIEWAYNILGMSVHDRVLAYARRYGTILPEGKLLVSASLQTISDGIGASREMVSRAVSALKAQGAVEPTSKSAPKRLVFNNLKRVGNGN